MKADFKKIDPIPADRLIEIMKENAKPGYKSMTAVELHELTGISEKHISNIRRKNKPLSANVAQKIVDAFPDREYETDWLLGKPGAYKTKSDTLAALLENFRCEAEETNEKSQRIKQEFNTLAGEVSINDSHSFATINGEEFPLMDYYRLIEELIKGVANSNHDIYEGIEALNALLTKMLEAQEKSFCIQKKQYDAFVNFTKFGRVS